MIKLTPQEKKDILDREIKLVAERVFLDDTQANFYTELAGAEKNIDIRYLNMATDARKSRDERQKYLEHLERRASDLVDKIGVGDVAPLEHITSHNGK